MDSGSSCPEGGYFAENPEGLSLGSQDKLAELLSIGNRVNSVALLSIGNWRAQVCRIADKSQKNQAFGNHIFYKTYFLLS